MTDWRSYQEEVSALFRELGCQTTVEATVQGTRSKHKIDVWVVFTRFGLEQRWVIECKKWQSPVPKEKVLTLRGVVEDVGADRGIIVADSGFQPGAITAANKTNITLTGLADLRTQASKDLQSIALRGLETKMLQFNDRATKSCDRFLDDDTTDIVGQIVNAVRDDDTTEIVGQLGTLEMGFQFVTLDRFPAPVGFFSADGISVDAHLVHAESVDEFIEQAALLLGFIEDRLQFLEKTRSRPGTS